MIRRLGIVLLFPFVLVAILVSVFLFPLSYVVTGEPDTWTLGLQGWIERHFFDQEEQ